MIKLLGIPLIIFAGLYGYFRGKSEKWALLWKALATSMAVLTGVYGALQNSESSNWLICVGLLFCMAADVLLEIRFRMGMIVFGAGHLSFIAAYWSRCTLSWLTIFVFAGIYAGIFVMFRKELSNLGDLKNAAFVYMALLGMMVSLAATSVWEVGLPWTRCTLAGGVCFLVSDVMIAWRTVKKKSSIGYDATLLVLYYAAVYLIAYSVVVG